MLICFTHAPVIRDGDLISVDDDVEEGARDLMELNDDGGHLKKRRGVCVCVDVYFNVLISFNLR